MYSFTAVEYCSYKGLTLITIMKMYIVNIVEYCSYKGLTLENDLLSFNLCTYLLNIVLIKDLNYACLNKKRNIATS